MNANTMNECENRRVTRREKKVDFTHMGFIQNFIKRNVKQTHTPINKRWILNAIREGIFSRYSSDRTDFFFKSSFFKFWHRISETFLLLSVVIRLLPLIAISTLKNLCMILKWIKRWTLLQVRVLRFEVFCGRSGHLLCRFVAYLHYSNHLFTRYC